MSKFNVGDRIRVIDYADPDTPALDKEGTITEISLYNLVVLDQPVNDNGYIVGTAEDPIFLLDSEIEHVN